MTNQNFAFTTKARILLNKILSPAGLHFETNTGLNAEGERLDKLKSKGHWQQEKYTLGLNLEEAKYIDFLNAICHPFKDDFKKIPKTVNSNNSNDYHYNNEFFSTVDAEVLYSIIRYYKPNNIIEIGSGFSTRLMRKAVGEGNLETRIICIDPQPRVDILDHADEHFSFYVENLEPDRILSKLNTGDILFIDSSHIVSTGGDVNYLFLEILPQLPVGTIVHIHDIFFPYDYPEEWVIKERWGWNEQYLVQAFLMFNDSFEIMWPSHFMWIKQRKLLTEIFPPAVNQYKPSSLWIRRIK